MADTPHRWPLASGTARLLFLEAVCVVSEGAEVLLSHTVRRSSSSSSSSSRCPPDACVGVVLGDPLRRVAVLGGREGMPRSLGSVYGGSVTRFLGGSLRGVVSRVIDTLGVTSYCNGVAVSVDGCTLLLSDSGLWKSNAIHEFDIEDGSRRRVIGEEGDGPSRFKDPRQVYVAPDGFVFVADSGNNRVQVLTPSLDFHCFIGQGQLQFSVGVCANADVVVASDYVGGCISVFNRCGGALLRRFGSQGSDDGQLHQPCGLCFMSGDHHVAVTELGNDRVSVFSIDGEFIRHVGVGILKNPQGVACSAFDELVVADTRNRRLRVFSATGDLLASVGAGRFSGVVVHGGTVFAADADEGTVSVFL
jgi:DNA-binding beta-propeller fold protein YncE